MIQQLILNWKKMDGGCQMAEKERNIRCLSSYDLRLLLVWQCLDYGLKGPGSNADRGKTVFCFSKRPDRFRGPPSLVFIG
jgi:hypothetical protein